MTERIVADRIGVEDLLAWYRDAGVDEPLGAEPIDRFRQSETITAEREQERARPRTAKSAPTPPLPSVPPSAARGGPPALSGEAAAREAAELAAGCADLAALKTAIESFEGCALKGTARSTLFADGEPGARLMVVGDVPDRDEDAEGRPFAGPSGAMLERMLAAIGLDAGDTYRLCASPWRKPGQRQLTPAEKSIAAPFLLRHVELARPTLVLAMGGAAAELLFGPGKALPALRGRWLDLDAGDHRAAALCTFHPNFLLRQPEQKRLAWADLLRLKERL